MSDVPIYLGPWMPIGGPGAWLLDLVFETAPTAKEREGIALPLAQLMKRGDLGPIRLPSHVFTSGRFVLITLDDSRRRGRGATLDHLMAFVREVHARMPLEHVALWSKMEHESSAGMPPGRYPRYLFGLAKVRAVDEALPAIEVDAELTRLRRKRYESLSETESRALHERLQKAYDKASSQNRIGFEPIPIEKARLRPFGPSMRGGAADVLPTDARFSSGPRLFCREERERLWYVDDSGAAREIEGGARLTSLTVLPDGSLGFAGDRGRLYRIDFCDGSMRQIWKTGTNITSVNCGPESNLLWVASAGRLDLVDVAHGSLGGIETEGTGHIIAIGDVCLIAGAAGKTRKPRTWVYAWRDGVVQEVDWIDCAIKVMFTWREEGDLYGEAWRHTGGSPSQLGGIAKSYGVIRNVAEQVEVRLNAAKKRKKRTKRKR